MDSINSTELSMIEKVTQYDRNATSMNLNDIPLSPDCSMYY
jgi:hypothetical protein